MELGDLLRETLSVDCDEVWDNKRTPDTRMPVGYGMRMNFSGVGFRNSLVSIPKVVVERLVCKFL